jgi:hypothetical protein
MASVPSVTSSLAGVQSALVTVALSETTATTNGSNPLAQPNGEVTIDFYQSDSDAQAAQILGTVGWKPYSNSTDETATLAVVNNGSGQSYFGTYADRSGATSDSDLWETSTPLDDPTQGLTPAYQIVLKRDGADALSATVTAADGTTSTIDLSTPAAASSNAPTSEPTAAATVPVAATPPPAPPPAAKPTTLATTGPEHLSLTFDANGDYNAFFTSTRAGVTSFLDAAAAYGTTLAIAPGTTVNVAG